MEYKASVKLTKTGQSKSLKAYASISIGNEFVVKGLTVRDGSNGNFVCMPSIKAGNEYRDIAFPITGEAREKITKAVLQAYEQELKNTEAKIGEKKKNVQKQGKVQSGNSDKKSDGKSNKQSKEHKAAAEEPAQEGQDETLRDAEDLSMGGM